MTSTFWLTVISGVEGAVLLIALIWALRKFLAPLEGIGRSLDKIAMGVRAIEQEAAPLGPRIDRANNTLTELGGGLGVVAQRLTHADGTLDVAGKILRGKS